METNNKPELTSAEAVEKKNTQQERSESSINRLNKEATRESLLAPMFDAVVPEYKKEEEKKTVLSSLQDITKNYMV